MSNDGTARNYTTDSITYGTYLRDNDPRMRGRVLQVTGFEEDYVFAKLRPGLPGNLARILRRRIYTDGKPRRSGWSVVNG